MYILTTDLGSGHVEVNLSVVGERLLLCTFRINHSRWWNTDQGNVVIGNLTQMLLGNKPRCGRKWKKSTRTINSILLSKRSLPKVGVISHLWKSRFTLCLCSFQFWVPCGRPTSPGAGQAGEDWLSRAEHDGRGTDTGVVSAQGDGVIDQKVTADCKNKKNTHWSL